MLRRTFFGAMLALVVAFAAPQALAATVSFYSHGWGLSGGGFLYFPHAFVVIERTADEPGGPSRESFGFTAASPESVMVTGRSAGVIMPHDERYASVARLHFRLQISPDEHAALLAAIDRWRVTDGNRYDLDRRNCISFVAALAQVLGLTTPGRVGRDPARFLAAVRQSNPDRLLSAAPAGAPAAAPDPAPGAFPP